MTEEEALELVANAVVEALGQNHRVQLAEAMEIEGETYITAEFWDEDEEQEVYASLKVELI